MKIKIKVFKFMVSNNIGQNLSASKNPTNLATPKVIEDTINDFIKDKMLSGIKINTITPLCYNNGQCNTVELVYTILYKDFQ